MTLLLSKLRAEKEQGSQTAQAKMRRDQVGRGCRGDKIRTIAVQRDDVTDHITGRRWSFRDYARGNW